MRCVSAPRVHANHDIIAEHTAYCVPVASQGVTTRHVELQRPMNTEARARSAVTSESQTKRHRCETHAGLPRRGVSRVAAASQLLTILSEHLMKGHMQAPRANPNPGSAHIQPVQVSPKLYNVSVERTSRCRCTVARLHFLTQLERARFSELKIPFPTYFLSLSPSV